MNRSIAFRIFFFCFDELKQDQSIASNYGRYNKGEDIAEKRYVTNKIKKKKMLTKVKMKEKEKKKDTALKRVKGTAAG